MDRAERPRWRRAHEGWVSLFFSLRFTMVKDANHFTFILSDTFRAPTLATTPAM